MISTSTKVCSIRYSTFRTDEQRCFQYTTIFWSINQIRRFLLIRSTLMIFLMEDPGSSTNIQMPEDDLQISSRGREKKFKLLFKYVDQNLFLTDKSDVLVPVNYGLSTKHNILKEFPSDSGVKVAGVYSE